MLKQRKNFKESCKFVTAWTAKKKIDKIDVKNDLRISINNIANIENISYSFTQEQIAWIIKVSKASNGEYQNW